MGVPNTPNQPEFFIFDIQPLTNYAKITKNTPPKFNIAPEKW